MKMETRDVNGTWRSTAGRTSLINLYQAIGKHCADQTVSFHYYYKYKLRMCYRLLIMLLHTGFRYSDTKRLIVVVECSRPLIRSWRTILRDYVGKLIGSFCGDETTGAAGPKFELSMVELNPPQSDSVVEKHIWTKNVELFLDWLNTLEFGDDEFPDVAIDEGLLLALKMFPSPNGGQNENLQNHCILVVATESHLSDAETVAKSYPQSSVSLSVICPTQLSGIKSIYYAGKKNPSAPDHTINLAKDPHYLVLISDNFKEACADLSHSGITVLPSNQECARNEFVQAWEGDLTGILNGQTVFIASLTGHLSSTASKSLVEDWPSTMLINRLVPHDFFENNLYDGTDKNVVFKATGHHILLEKMHKNDLWAVILLPSQVLAVITLVKEEDHYQMVGMILPKDGFAEDLSQHLQD